MRILVMTAMYPTPENPAFGSFVKTQVHALRAAGIGVELLVFRGCNRKLMYLNGLAEMRKRLHTGGIDLVHAHYSYVGAVARTQRRVPVVVTFHGDDLLASVADDTGRHTKSSLLMARCGQWLGRHIDAAIVQSDEMAGKLKHAAHVHIVPHEVDFETFRVVDRGVARQELGLDAEKPYLLFAADPRIPVKRFSLARQVVERLQRDIPDAELLVVCREPQWRLALFMNACDALLFPSFQEGSPNVVKQAMACNLPIVATDVGDVRAVIGNTEGCAVSEPHVGDFVGCLREILGPPRRTNGRDHVRRFERPVVARQLIDVYVRVLDARNARRQDAAQSPSIKQGRNGSSSGCHVVRGKA